MPVDKPVLNATVISHAKFMLTCILCGSSLHQKQHHSAVQRAKTSPRTEFSKHMGTTCHTPPVGLQQRLRLQKGLISVYLAINLPNRLMITDWPSPIDVQPRNSIRRNGSAHADAICCHKRKTSVAAGRMGRCRHPARRTSLNFKEN